MKKTKPAWYQSHIDFDAYNRRMHDYGFADYIQAQKAHIEHYRAKAELSCSEHIVTMNAPFEMRPDHFDGQHGVLLIHGFLVSPYVMRAMGEYYASQGYLVRAIVLPGHGTRPGDLLNARLDHWQQAVDYGIQTLQQECQSIHLCGFSLGGTLSYLASLRHNIDTLCLLAPAFGITRLACFLPFISILGKLLGAPFLRWNNQIQEDNWIMYNAYPMISARQVAKAVKFAKTRLKQRGNATPTFLVASVEDATVKFTAIKHAFQQFDNQRKQLLIFSKDESISNVSGNTIVIDSTDKARRIVAQSHVGLPVTPDDAYLGHHGTYYEKDGNNYTYGEILLGLERQHQHFRRLTYNPHFDQMMTHLGVFLNSHAGSY